MYSQGAQYRKVIRSEFRGLVQTIRQYMGWVFRGR